MAIKALIADDDESIRQILRELLSERRMQIIECEDGLIASKRLNDDLPDIALLDINMPGKDGLDLIRDASPKTAVIVMTADATVANAIEAMKRGAFDYVTKPFDLDEVELIVSRALESSRLKKELQEVGERYKGLVTKDASFVGRSRAAQQIYKTIGKVAPTDATVLLLGESGTGKELLARLIHANSKRCTGPFIALNSAAVPKDLMESELFGFERGAFTGAHEEKKGKFELADKGTLFLDEVGDTPLELQSKLLRAIQEREFFRLGAKAPTRPDVRIIAATNQDLEKAVEEKRFREDLYHRLNVVAVKVPPLRERRSDVASLAAYFLEKFSLSDGSSSAMPPKVLSQEALKALEQYGWPGNVRELENTLRRAHILSAGRVITIEDLGLPQTNGKGESLEDVISARLRPVIDKTATKGNQELYDFIMPFMERPLIRLVLEKTRWNQLKTAELLGINRNTLRKKIKDLGIKPPKD